MEESKVIIGTALNRHVRFYLGDTTKLVYDAGKIHDCWPTSLAALGRVLSVSACMGLMQKGNDESDVLVQQLELLAGSNKKVVQNI